MGKRFLKSAEYKNSSSFFSFKKKKKRGKKRKSKELGTGNGKVLYTAIVSRHDPIWPFHPLRDARNLDEKPTGREHLAARLEIAESGVPEPPAS